MYIATGYYFHIVVPFILHDADDTLANFSAAAFDQLQETIFAYD